MTEDERANIIKEEILTLFRFAKYYSFSIKIVDDIPKVRFKKIKGHHLARIQEELLTSGYLSHVVVSAEKII